MAKLKYDLEELRSKVETGAYIGVRQLEFVFSVLDEQKARAEKAEAERDVLAERLSFHGHLPCSENGDCPQSDPEACTNCTRGDCWLEWAAAEVQRRTDTAIDRLRKMCEAASTHIEARDNCIYAVDLAEDMRGMLIAEFNQAVPRCYNNIEMFMTSRTAIPALLNLVEAHDNYLSIADEIAEFRENNLVPARLPDDLRQRIDAAYDCREAARQRLEEVCPK